MIGEAEVERLIKTIHPDARITNPITACKSRINKIRDKEAGIIDAICCSGDTSNAR